MFTSFNDLALPVEACVVLGIIEFGELAWITAGGATTVTAALVAQAFYLQRSHSADRRDASEIWVSMGAAARRIADGEGDPSDVERVLTTLDDPETNTNAIESVVAVIRSHAGEVHPDLYGTVAASSVVAQLRSQLAQSDPMGRTAALEMIEVLRVGSLSGEVADGALDADEDVARAACAALVVIAPRLAIGVLTGRVRSGGPWVADMLNDAATALSLTGRQTELKHLWTDVPTLAERSINNADGFDASALSAITDLLHHEELDYRLGAIRALSKTVELPAAQIALLGALESEDRVTRFAAASRLAESPLGRTVIRHYADTGCSSDAVEAAAIVLWNHTEPDLLTSADFDVATDALGELATVHHLTSVPF